MRKKEKSSEVVNSLSVEESWGEQRIRLSVLPPISPTFSSDDKPGGHSIKFSSKLCMCVSLARESLGITCLMSYK